MSSCRCYCRIWVKLFHSLSSFYLFLRTSFEGAMSSTAIAATWKLSHQFPGIIFAYEKQQHSPFVSHCEQHTTKLWLMIVSHLDSPWNVAFKENARTERIFQNWKCGEFVHTKQISWRSRTHKSAPLMASRCKWTMRELLFSCFNQPDSSLSWFVFHSLSIKKERSHEIYDFPEREESRMTFSSAAVLVVTLLSCRESVEITHRREKRGSASRRKNWIFPLDLH